ncbi:glycosyl hydrolase family 28-related protein [Puia sp.]|uniref:glycosyl hydrolase family 28-related protein n=1 Tax=Puia sp. TaxID=2045100 RepID=UPI002F42A389
MKSYVRIVTFILLLPVVTGAAPLPGVSVFRTRPDDPHALYFTADNYKITADGKTDVSDALQEAIRTLKTRDNFGIIFIPEGTYRISKTIYIPTAIRLIGFGKTRPLIVLGRNSPGFQSADPGDKGQGRYMFWFVSGLSAPGQPVRDAGASTFYSAMSNINLRIGDGNPAAIALRTHFAQHSYISHVDIDAGNGRAGLFDVGNEMEDIRFFGGDYGIFTTKPSPGWPCAIVDSWFEGQRRAAIRTREAGLVLIRLQAKQVPVVVDIDSNYHEKLFMEDCRFEGIKETAIRISNEDNAFSQVNLRNIACRNTPVLAEGRLTHRRTTAPSPIYLVKSFTDGLQIDGWVADPVYATTKDIQSVSVMPSVAPSDIPAFPDAALWTNLRSLGAKGDGVSDDTKVIQEAIDHHDILYVPEGWYRLTAPLHLRPNTVFIGLHPFATQFLIADNTPAFGGFGGPQPMVETPVGGRNILSGIGLNTNASNPRAVACKWQSGEHSYMNDVKFIGGHGGIPRPNTTDTARRQSERDWDTQYWSLWVTNGGGGTFKDIWSANTYATAGAYFSHTSTPGRIYALSVEHHVRNEVRFNAVANWKVYALQLEEESRESTECQPMELEDCHDMTFANLYMFRVIRVNKPYPWSIRRWGGHNLEFLNVHNYSQIIYTTTDPLYDVNTNTTVRPWEFARLFIGEETTASDASAAPATTQLATGFEFAQSPCADSKGNIYFCDSRLRRIYRYSPATRQTTLLADYPWQPLSLACDKKDNLLVVFKYVPKPGTGETFTNPPDAAGTSFSGWGNSGFATWVYSIDPDNPDETIRLLPTQPMGSIDPVDRALYPAHRWRDYHDFNTVSVQRPQQCFVAPDGVTIIPVVYDLARSTALAAARPGKPLYTTDEYDKRTVRTNVDPKGILSDLSYFAQRGEFATATDAAGNVYIADGEIYVYDPQGHLIKTLKTPERPTGLSFGADSQTLFITGHNSLYRLSIN